MAQANPSVLPAAHHQPHLQALTGPLGLQPQLPLLGCCPNQALLSPGPTSLHCALHAPPGLWHRPSLATGSSTASGTFPLPKRKPHPSKQGLPAGPPSLLPVLQDLLGASGAWAVPMATCIRMPAPLSSPPPHARRGHARSSTAVCQGPPHQPRLREQSSQAPGVVCTLYLFEKQSGGERASNGGRLTFPQVRGRTLPLSSIPEE